LLWDIPSFVLEMSTSFTSYTV